MPLVLLTADDVALEPLPADHIAASSGQPQGQSISLLALSLALPAVKSPLLVYLPHRSTILSAVVIVSDRLSISEPMRLSLLFGGDIVFLHDQININLVRFPYRCLGLTAFFAAVLVEFLAFLPFPSAPMSFPPCRAILEQPLPFCSSKTLLMFPAACGQLFFLHGHVNMDPNQQLRQS